MLVPSTFTGQFSEVSLWPSNCVNGPVVAVKAIGEAARKEMEALFDRRVHLFLFVKVREAWLDDPERYRAMGLEFPKE